MKRSLRLVGLGMLIIGTLAVLYVINTPAPDGVIALGWLRFRPEQWQVCCRIYLAAIVGLLAGSWFIKDE